MLNGFHLTFFNITLKLFKKKYRVLYIYKMDCIELELNTINIVIKGLNKQIEVLEERKKVIIGTGSITEFKCINCNLIFGSQAERDKHMVSKKHNDKIGVAPIKCSLCQNSFFGKDLVKHMEDGRCEKSRTCNGCGVTFNSMMRKSRHECSKRFVDEADNTENITKKKKLKLKTKTKPPPPMPEPVAPPPSPVSKTPSNSLFLNADPIKYKLKPIPASCENVTPEWYEDLHYSMNKKNVFWEDMQSESSIIDNAIDDFPMYSKGDTMFYKEDDTEAFKIDYNGGRYYKLICLYEEEVEEVEATIIDNLECLSTLGEKNMTEELYQSLHKHHNLEMHDFLPAEFTQKFNSNCADIMDCAYQDGSYLFYNHDGYLCRGQEKLFRFFKHSSGLIYDMEAVEENICDPDTEEEIEMMEEFEEDEDYE